MGDTKSSQQVLKTDDTSGNVNEILRNPERLPGNLQKQTLFV